MKIDGAIALVTGGLGGLGRPLCDMLALRGAKVIVADRNAEGLKTLPEHFDRCLLDVCDPLAAKKEIAALREKHGAIDLLVNCAGAIVSAPFVNIFSRDSMMLPYERFRKDLAINLDSVFIVTSAVVEQMVLTRTKGCVISISSISGHGNAGQTSYAAAKAAVNAMTVTWAKELGKLGIRCNAVAPGFIGTPSTHSALSESQIKHIVANTPIGRLGTPEEVGAAVIALAENDFINGAILDVNGGLTL
ncbi:MAG: SDR family oxidoreductase [Desulfovibrionaceae bacterium]|nr:SDR family oxidoreductase [Desulfovibrionaceae bacterium]